MDDRCGRAVRLPVASGACYASIMEQTDDHQAGKGVNAGLCADCVHSRRIESARDSLFFLCDLSFTDPRFPKYPRLPVLCCDGYKKKL